MEVIDVPGYTQGDKLMIARKFLLPRQLREHGVNEKIVRIPAKTIEAVIDKYTREAGVRNLDRTLAGVIRGTAAKIAEQVDEQADRAASKRGKAGENGHPPAAVPAVAVKDEKVRVKDRLAGIEPITVLPADLHRLLGPQRFESELAQRTASPGVVTGLAYTPVGGEILFIEATQMPGKGALTLTGQIGEVMKESVQAAFSLLKHNAAHLKIDPEIFAKTDVHVHVPAGAVPKRWAVGGHCDVYGVVFAVFEQAGAAGPGDDR